MRRFSARSNAFVPADHSASSASCGLSTSGRRSPRSFRPRSVRIGFPLRRPVGGRDREPGRCRSPRSKRLQQVRRRHGSSSPGPHSQSLLASNRTAILRYGTHTGSSQSTMPSNEPSRSPQWLMSRRGVLVAIGLQSNARASRRSLRCRPQEGLISQARCCRRRVRSVRLT